MKLAFHLGNYCHGVLPGVTECIFHVHDWVKVKGLMIIISIVLLKDESVQDWDLHLLQLTTYVLRWNYFYAKLSLSSALDLFLLNSCILNPSSVNRLTYSLLNTCWTFLCRYVHPFKPWYVWCWSFWCNFTSRKCKC